VFKITFSVSISRNTEWSRKNCTKFNAP